MGTDGHTASLFPGDDACDEQERRCVPATAPNGSKRLTLTFPTLNAARHVIFLVLGADKRDALRQDPERRSSCRRPGSRRRAATSPGSSTSPRTASLTARAPAAPILRRRCAR